MRTFDQHLQAGRITMDAVVRVATSPHDFKLVVAASASPEGGEPEEDAPLATLSPALSAPPPGARHLHVNDVVVV
jgi:twitching motility protein PilT